MSVPTAIGRRVVVVGVSGVGKTTLARALAERLAAPHIELDALLWGPNWTERPLEEFRADVTTAVAADAWAADGNSSRTRDLIWPRAQTVIWLDYPLPIILAQLARRTARRVLRQELLWQGNRETLRKTFSRDSILLWALTTWRRRRREYPILFRQPEYAHLQVIRLHSRAETQRWLRALELPPAAAT